MDKILFSYDELSAATSGTWTKAADGFSTVSEIKSDSRADLKGAMFIALPGETFDGHSFLQKAADSGARVLCINKSYTGAVPAGISILRVENTLTAYHDMALLHRKKMKNLKVIGITGSSGKTSTKELVKSVFVEAFGAEQVLATEGNTNNHVGVPQNLLRLTESHKIAIIEMGTNHPGEIEVLARMALPDLCVISFVGSSHIENFGSIEAIAAEKASIFKPMPQNGTAVIPFESNQLAILEKYAAGFNILRFGQKNGADLKISYLGGKLHGSSFELTDRRNGKNIRVNSKLSGIHQALNSSAAAAAGIAFGISMETIAAGLEKCVLPGMRMRISVKNGVTWINDAYNANPDSMKAGIEWLSEFMDQSKLILVLGDMLELGEHADAAHKQMLQLAFSKFPAAKIIGIGPKMTAAASLPEFAGKILHFENSGAAAETVRRLPETGDFVYLKASRGTKLEIIEPA